MSMKLRDLIRKVRACKTAAEERAVIAKESAMIRTAIREEQVHYRHRNVAKLLFMHMLGYPTHFGQLECMKLTASPHFPEKRIGYLGMMLLLSEEADVLMLATNALKNDLNSENKFVAGLALTAIGNLATADMSRDLAPEVDKHLKSPLAYLRKKACLAMARCLAKCPEMVEDFVERVVTLLRDKSHGVLVTVVQLMTQVLLIDARNAVEEGQDPSETPCRTAFLRSLPALVKMLRSLQTGGGGYAEHEVGGVSDPFLQVQLLQLLRLLGTNNDQAAEEMNDVLAQVASNTDSAKNAGNAILYECVQTIMGIPSEEGLRVLAVNILGRFLLNRDNNIRYVALNTLARCIVEQKQQENENAVESDESANSAMSALQRHRTTVVDCLKDPDVSIRQRALELIYHLVNENNVESLTAELLSYLVLCPVEHRTDICTRILKVVDRYSPSDRWRVDTLITTLTIAGREANRDVQSATALYISRATPDVHAMASHKLCKAMRDDDGSQHGLLAVAVWCLGEYGDLLLQPYASDGQTYASMTPQEIVQAVDSVAKRHSCPEIVQQRALTAYVKLGSRLSPHDPNIYSTLERLIQKHCKSRSLELQLRACEYYALIHAAQGKVAPKVAPPPAPAAAGSVEVDLFGDSLGLETSSSASGTVSAAVVEAAKEALARMPVVDAKVLQKRMSTDEMSEDALPRRKPAAPKAAAQGAAPSSGLGGDLLDLADIFAATPAAPQTNGDARGTIVALPTATTSSAIKSDLDLLSDIFAAPPVAAAPMASMQPVNMMSNPMDLFGAPSTMAPAPVMPMSNPMDLFGAPPAPAVSLQPQVPASNPLDLFGAPPAVSAPVMNNMFGASPTPAVPPSVRVPGLTHAGLQLEFACSKPLPSNPQKSTLVAHMLNTTNGPMVGMNLQVAVPKFVLMEMQPPSSTTVAPGKFVTQTITVTNSQLGTKNLVLKVKLTFTVAATNQKIEHMGTCSGFPPGQY